MNAPADRPITFARRNRWRKIALVAITFLNVTFWAVEVYAVIFDPNYIPPSKVSLTENIIGTLVLLTTVIAFPAATTLIMPRLYGIAGFLQSCVPVICAASFSLRMHRHMSSVYDAMQGTGIAGVVSLILAVAPAAAIRYRLEKASRQRNSQAAAADALLTQKSSGANVWPPPPRV